MREIPLTGGRGVALVDDADYDVLIRHRWHLSPQGYAVGSTHGRKTLMHRVILSCMPGDREVDHRDHVRLNNQRENLRRCTRTENQRNSRKWSHRRGEPCSSRFKGVVAIRRGGVWMGKWTAFIRRHGSQDCLGTFESEETAARAYDAAAREHFGEFAYLNFPAGQSERGRQ